MTKRELKTLLEQESNSVEWKAGGDPEKIVKTLVAFANDFESAGRGVVLCGIAEETDGKGRVKGITSAEARKLEDRVFELVRARVDPLIEPRFEQVTVGPKLRVLAIWVEPSSEIHQFQRATVIRLGNKVTTANAKQTATLAERKAGLDWLAQPCPGATVEDVDFFAMEEISRGRLPEGGPKELLRPNVRMFGTALPLTAQQASPLGNVVSLHRFAVLLVGREPQRFMPGAFIKLTRFPGTARTGTVFVSEEFSGPIPMLVRNVMGALEPAIVTDKTQNGSQNRDRYSRQALHEVLVNALAHRDYRDPAAIKIAVFSDRIEFESPGGLPDFEKLDAIKQGRTRWRNPSLARFLVHLGLAQEVGSGIPTVIEETRKVAGREPVFETNTWFRVVVPAYVPARSMASTYEVGREAGVLVVSVGYGTIDPILVRRSHPAFEKMPDEDFLVFHHPVLRGEEDWRHATSEIRDWARRCLEDPRFKELHLFYRGPVAIAPLLGALAVGRKPLVVHYYDEERSAYREAYRLDRRLLQDE